MSLTNLFDRTSETQRATLNRRIETLTSIWKELRARPTALLSLLILVSFGLIALLAPILAPYDPQESFGAAYRLQSPSLTHPMGTDQLGRDVLSQWIWGSRVSVFVGLVSGFVVMVIGTTVGLISGYYKGKVDMFLMRIVDIMYGIPATPLIVVLALFFGPSIWNIIVAMALVLWRTMARIVRSQTLSVSERPFVKAARATGASDLRIMFVHILPNLAPLIFIQTTITIGFAIVLEAGISFLGLGATEVLSWGVMLQLTFDTGAIRHAWWWVLPPGLGITVIVFSVFYLSRVAENVANPDIEYK